MSLRFMPVIISDATTYAVKDYNSGLLHVIPDVTATITITLPTPKKGLKYEFIYGGAAADAANFVISTGSNTNYFHGNVLWIDEDSATDNAAAVFSDNNSNSVLTAVVPSGGTRIEVVSNGTIWYLHGVIHAATVPTIADA
jgi:hypothetical protein